MSFQGFSRVSLSLCHLTHRGPGIIDTYYTSSFPGVLGIQNQVLILAGQSFYPLSHISSPTLFGFFVFTFLLVWFCFLSHGLSLVLWAYCR